MSSRRPQSAGFDTVTVKRIPQIWRLESVVRLFTAMLGATVRTGGLLQAQTPAALERIRRAVSEAVAPYRSGDAMRYQCRPCWLGRYRPLY